MKVLVKTTLTHSVSYGNAEVQINRYDDIIAVFPHNSLEHYDEYKLEEIESITISK